MNRKGKSYKQCFYRNNKNVLRYQKLQHVFECCLSALIQPHNRFTTRLFPKSIVRTSAKKSAVQVCQVAAVVMETIQLVVSQFENFLP